MVIKNDSTVIIGDRPFTDSIRMKPAIVANFGYFYDVYALNSLSVQGNISFRGNLIGGPKAAL